MKTNDDFLARAEELRRDVAAIEPQTAWTQAAASNLAGAVDNLRWHGEAAAKGARKGSLPPEGGVPDRRA